MKKTLIILFSLLAVVACKGLVDGSPYEGQLHKLNITVVFDEDVVVDPSLRLELSVENNGTGAFYSATIVDGASLSLPNGIYRVSISGRNGKEFYNGVVDKVRLIGSDASVNVNVMQGEAGVLVIKEVYSGGCKKTDADHPEGYADYQSDKYIVIHNNSPAVQYLDSLCIGTLDPYRSGSESVWISEGYDFAPIIQAVLQIPGDGTTFPLAPGEDAVICLCGAIDHAAQFPMSVNLNKEDYFVLYEPAYFPNELYHPTPGPAIQSSRYLKVVIKMGQANAYTIAVQSPAVVLFKTKGVKIEDYVLQSGVVIQKPGSNADKIVAIPWKWVVDAVEVFENSTTNKKRVSPRCDAGYVRLTQVFAGHSLLRRVDEAESATLGFEVLQDTNNSTNDFFESDKQTLHADYGK